MVLVFSETANEILLQISSRYLISGLRISIYVSKNVYFSSLQLQIYSGIAYFLLEK